MSSPRPSSAARCSAASACPPSQIGGCGLCTGFGCIGILSRCEKRPSSVTLPSEAITYYDKALAIDPNDKEALNGKNDTLSHMPSNKTADENKSPAPNNQTYIKPPLLPPI